MKQYFKRSFAVLLICGAVGLSACGGSNAATTTEDAATAEDNNASTALSTEALTITTTIPAN